MQLSRAIRSMGLSSILVILLALALFVPCPASSDSASVNNWETLARQYVLADQKLLELEEKKLEGIPRQIDLRDELRASLVKVASPTVDRLKLLIGSSDPLERKTALVAFFVNKLTSPDIVALFLSRYDKEDDFFIRFYIHQGLMNLSDDQLRTMQADVSRIITAEKYETLQITSLPTLLRLERDVTMPILVGYFKKGSPWLKKAAYASLRSNGKSDYIKKVKATLKTDKATSAIEFLNGLEKD